MRTAKNNPYVEKSFQFSGRLFNFEDFEGERDAVRRLCSGAAGVVAEFGSGSGAHLIELARRNPDQLMIGFERRYKRAVRTIEKALEMGLENLVICRTNVERAVEILPKNSLLALYVNFPDPWIKKRGAKHRLLAPRLLDWAAMLLVSRTESLTGFLSVKTDEFPYFSEFEAVALVDRRFEKVYSTYDLYSEPALREQNIATEFERLFLSQGVKINGMKLRYVGE